METLSSAMETRPNPLRLPQVARTPWQPKAEAPMLSAREEKQFRRNAPPLEKNLLWRLFLAGLNASP